MQMSRDKWISHFKSSLDQIPQKQQKTDEWIKFKKKIISATEVSTIDGCNPFQTINELYYQKCHPEESFNKSSQATEWGEKYEPIAKTLYKERNRDVLEIIDVGLSTHPMTTFLGASPDGLVLINNNGLTELWLVEIKCLHMRTIEKTIPYNYWLQIQTQLYVWGAIFKQFNIDLKGCVYIENEFTDGDEDKLKDYWEHRVIFNEKFYLNEILPEIQTFYENLSLKSNPKLATSKTNSKKRKGSDDSNLTDTKITKKYFLEKSITKNNKSFPVNELYFDYLQSRNLISQKQYRNFVNQDPLLDWLHYYGEDAGFKKDPPTNSQYNVLTYIGQQSHKFNQLVIKYIQSKSSQNDIIKIGETDFEKYGEDPQLYQFHKNPNSLSRRDYEETLNSLSKGVPIIVNGCLYHPKAKTIARYDLLIKFSHLASIFPIAKQKLDEIDVYGKDDYVSIQTRYSKLKLCAKNLYLLNQGSQKSYKIENAHLSQVLNYYQPNASSSTLLIMGRKSCYTGRGVSYDNKDAIGSFGVVDFESRDAEIREDFLTAFEWLNDVKTKGHRWSIDPPSNPSLYPNLKNNYDNQWSQFKKELATKNHDLTTLWYLGPTERNRLWESGNSVKRWDKLDVNDLKYNDHYKNIIRNSIASQKTQQPVNLEALGTHLEKMRKPIEFFLDFEFVPEIVDDFKTFPISRSDKYIYMIGCVYVNHETGESKYLNSVVNRLDKDNEKDMFESFFKQINHYNQNQSEINIYHWGVAEKTQLQNYLNSRDQTGDTPNQNQTGVMGVSPNQSQSNRAQQTICKLNLIDLCDLFKICEVGLPNCFGFGLKEIAKTFYDLKWIKTCWTDQLTGEDAMVGAIVCDQQCQEGKYQSLHDVPLMKDLIQYNYYDCLIPKEIVDYVINLNCSKS